MNLEEELKSIENQFNLTKNKLEEGEAICIKLREELQQLKGSYRTVSSLINKLKTEEKEESKEIKPNPKK